MKRTVNSNSRLKLLFTVAGASELKDIYARHGADTPAGLVNKIRRDGSNTLVTYIYRWGDGVDYDEVVRDVGCKIGISRGLSKIENEMQSELLIIQQFIKKSVRLLSPEQKMELNRELSALGKHYEDFWRQLTNASGRVLLELITTVGPKIFADMLSQVVTRILIICGSKVAAATIIGLAIPLINLALGTWLIIDLLGPAYRKTVPTVLQIALLRLKYGYNPEVYRI